MYFITFLLNAQNPHFVVQQMFYFPSKNVIDISCFNDDIYLNTIDSLYIISKKGKLKDRRSKEQKDYIFLDSMFYIIDQNIVSNMTNKVVFSLNNKINSDKKVMKFLSKSGNTYFTCLIDTPNISYSSNIAQIDDNNNCFPFAYIVGNPSGLSSDGKYLWYLYNKSSKGGNGIIRKYDIKTGKLMFTTEIPVRNPIGLYIIKNIIYTFSNFSGNLYQLTIEK